ncbi:hypothetical protein [Calidithermus terrae]|uniref:hypothetical protein n=1 Tax=Calidithermus terrae TaxID=1408545 RepID=UPI0011C3C512|nr:hypothetical protein [Calidithermus terrae]
MSTNESTVTEIACLNANFLRIKEDSVAKPRLVPLLVLLAISFVMRITGLLLMNLVYDGKIKGLNPVMSAIFDILHALLVYFPIVLHVVFTIGISDYLRRILIKRSESQFLAWIVFLTSLVFWTLLGLFRFFATWV